MATSNNKRRQAAAQSTASLEYEYGTEEKPSILLTIVDAGMLAAIFGVPLAMGGREALGRLVLVIAATIIALGWSLHQLFQKQPRWTWTRAEPILAAGILLGLFQTIQLSSGLVQTLSPRIAELLPVWTNDVATGAALGEWTQLSLSIEATRSGVMTMVAYTLIFVVTAQRLRSIADVERLLKWCCLSVAAMTLFALAQYFVGNGKFFWFYDHPYTSAGDYVKGSFTNRNHFAHFLALGIGPFLWWILKTSGDNKAPLATFHSHREVREIHVGVPIILLAVVAFAGLLSLSRGGTLAMAVAGAICVVVLSWHRLISAKLLAGLLGIALLAGGFLYVFGAEYVSLRLSNWDPSSRKAIWRANLDTIHDFPILGTGWGSHVDAYQQHLDLPFQTREFTHAENGYLQIASESGFVGLGLGLLAIMVCLFWCMQGLRKNSGKKSVAALAAVTAGLAANFLHSLADFVWYVPGCMVLVIAFAASACRLYQMGREANSGSDATALRFTRPAPRLAWGMALFATFAVGMWMLEARIPQFLAEQHWHDYLQLGDEIDADDTTLTTEDQQLIARRLQALSLAAKSDPENAMIQLRLARGYMSLFHILQRSAENPMTLAQIRDATQAAQFESKEAMDEWLNKPGVIGKTRKFLDAALDHTRRCLANRPLLAPGYLHLAELSFLEGDRPESQREYINQALAVRPYDPQVLFVAGREAWSSGEIDQGIDYWRMAFQRSVDFQTRIVDLLTANLAASAPGSSARFIIDEFQPDWEAVYRLKQHYEQLQSPSDYTVVLHEFADQTIDRIHSGEDDPSKTAWLYAQALEAYDRLGDEQSATAALNAAIKTDPNSYDARYAIGTWLYRRQKFAQAAEHLQWCLQRKPNDELLQKMAQRATTEQIRGNSGIRQVSGIESAGEVQ